MLLEHRLGGVSVQQQVAAAQLRTYKPRASAGGAAAEVAPGGASTSAAVAGAAIPGSTEPQAEVQGEQATAAAEEATEPAMAEGSAASTEAPTQVGPLAEAAAAAGPAATEEAAGGSKEPSAAPATQPMLCITILVDSSRPERQLEMEVATKYAGGSTACNSEQKVYTDARGHLNNVELHYAAKWLDQVSVQVRLLGSGDTPPHTCFHACSPAELWSAVAGPGFAEQLARAVADKLAGIEGGKELQGLPELPAHLLVRLRRALRKHLGSAAAWALLQQAGLAPQGADGQAGAEGISWGDSGAEDGGDSEEENEEDEEEEEEDEEAKARKWLQRTQAGMAHGELDEEEEDGGEGSQCGSVDGGTRVGEGSEEDEEDAGEGVQGRGFPPRPLAVPSSLARGSRPPRASSSHASQRAVQAVQAVQEGGPYTSLPCTVAAPPFAFMSMGGSMEGGGAGAGAGAGQLSSRRACRTKGKRGGNGAAAEATTAWPATFVAPAALSPSFSQTPASAPAPAALSWPPASVSFAPPPSTPNFTPAASGTSFPTFSQPAAARPSVAAAGPVFSARPAGASAAAPAPAASSTSFFGQGMAFGFEDGTQDVFMLEEDAAAALQHVRQVWKRRCRMLACCTAYACNLAVCPLLQPFCMCPNSCLA